MTDRVHDPVNGVRYAFERDGENLIVDCLVDSGGALPAHRHPRSKSQPLPNPSTRTNSGSAPRMFCSYRCGRTTP